MERLSITTPAEVGTGLSIAAVCGALALSVSLMRVTAADRLVDGGYDKVIATASSLQEPAGTKLSILRLATHSVKPQPSFPTAATEHAWLTRPVLHGEAAAVEPVPFEAATAPTAGVLIGSSVGARFTIASADSVQTLEVIDVSEISAEQLNRAATSMTAAAKMLLVSCRVVGDAKSPASKMTADRDKVVRFIVDAGTAHAVRLPRAL
jgi:hypothetical protein